jgi:hypothetical protein
MNGGHFWLSSMQTDCYEKRYYYSSDCHDSGLSALVWRIMVVNTDRPLSNGVVHVGGLCVSLIQIDPSGRVVVAFACSYCTQTTLERRIVVAFECCWCTQPALERRTIGTFGCS